METNLTLKNIITYLNDKYNTELSIDQKRPRIILLINNPNKTELVEELLNSDIEKIINESTRILAILKSGGLVSLKRKIKNNLI